MTMREISLICNSSCNSGCRACKQMMSVHTYRKTQGFARTHGQMYEVKISALLFLRGIRSGKPFRLASNVAEAGAFDDVVYKYQEICEDHFVWYTLFIQLKHKERGSVKILISNLTGPRNDFALKKYQESFTTIKQNMKPGNEDLLFDGDLDNCAVILYTNAEASDELKRRTRTSNPSNVTDIVRSRTEKEFIFRFCESVDGEIYNALDKECDDTKEFLERLVVFSGEPGVDDLDDIVKQEMIVVCREVPKGVIDLIVPTFVDHVREWWSNSDVILDENSDILKTSIHQYTVGNLVAQQEKQLSLNVKFQDVFTSDLKRALNEGFSLLHVTSNDPCLRLSNTKILQVLWERNEALIFLGLECFLSEPHTVISAWKSGKKDTLVLTTDIRNGTVNVIDTIGPEIIDDISKTLLKKDNKRVILISHPDETLSGILKSKLENSYVLLIDRCDLSQLDRESISRIMETKINFQGSSVEIQYLVRCEVEGIVIDLQSNLLAEVTGECDASVFGNELGVDLSYFIQRTLLRHDHVRKDIFKSREFSGRLAISGVAMDELQKLLPFDLEDFQKLVTYADSPEHVFSQHLLLDSSALDQQFAGLCLTYKDIHWVQVQDGDFVWKRTNGDISNIIQFVDEAKCTTYEPELSCGIDDRVVLLIAEPGMGKSTQLTHLANRIKANNPHVWIIRIDLNDHTELLNKTSRDDFNSVDFLATALGIDERSRLEKEIFRFSLERRGNIVVLLDGFDEISPRYTEEGKCLLASLLNTKVQKVWISSRYSMKEQLESPLSTLSTNLQRFTVEDQIDFFTKYWAGVNTPLTYDELKEFIVRLLEMTANSMNDKEKQFTGIPLQSQMLAEVFEGHVRYPNVHKLPETLDLLSLYEKFVDKKFDIYIDEKRRLRTHGTDDDDLLDMLRDAFNKNHTYAALMLLFDDVDLEQLAMGNVVKKCEKFLTAIKNGREKTGIVDRVVNDKPNFAHQTFAEYFVAVWLSKNFKRYGTFLEKNMFGVNFKVIRNIFDRIIARDHPLHIAVLNGDVKDVEALLTSRQFDANARDDGGRTALHIAASFGFKTTTAESEKSVHILKLLVEHGGDLTISDTHVLQVTPLKLADATGSWDVVDFILKQPHVDDKDLIRTRQASNKRDLLNVVTKHGFVTLTSFLLDHGTDVDTLVDDTSKSSLLHRASECGHAELVRLLIERGGNIDTLDKDQSTPLHLAAYRNRVAVAEVLLMSARCDEGVLNEYLDRCDLDGRNALHVASREGHPEMVALLLRFGADVLSTSTTTGRTPLHETAVFGHVTVARVLLDGRVDVQKCLDARNKNGATAMHTAAEEGHPGVVRMLVARGMKVTEVDSKGNTALHLAASLGHLNVAEALLECFYVDKMVDDGDKMEVIGNKMVKGSGEIVAVSDKMEVITNEMVAGNDKMAVDGYKMEVVKDKMLTVGDKTAVVSDKMEVFGDNMTIVTTTMVEIVEYVNTRDSSGWTALHNASRAGDRKIVEFLIRHGADVTLRNAAKLTPLHFASYFGHLSVTQFLVNAVANDAEKAVDYIKAVDGSGQTAMSMCKTRKKFEVLKWLEDTLKVLESEMLTTKEPE